jgi:ribosomal protein L22
MSFETEEPREDAPVSEAPSETSASETDAPSTPATGDEFSPTAADEQAEEATEVVLEADDEAEGEPETATTTEEAVAVAEAADAAGAESETEIVPAETAEVVAPAQEQPARRFGRRGRRSGGEVAQPGAAPRRRRDRPAGPAPVVRAQAKYVRSSARKARLVCDHIRGKSVEEARAILAHTPRAVAREWSKLLESAVANAENNHSLDGEDLYVKAVHADEGPTIKRFRPRAMGRATKIRKRTTHLTILLTPKD